MQGQEHALAQQSVREEAERRPRFPELLPGSAVLEKGSAQARVTVLKPRHSLLGTEGPDEQLSYEIEF